MASFPRYAIYYVPPRDSALDRFGSHHLGYDAWTGSDRSFPDDIKQDVPDWREVTEDARKYGFHATLKAPMALAEGKTEASLLEACNAFADTSRAIPIIRPVVAEISGFIAIIPAEQTAELDQLARDCVTVFDSFRPPLSPDDRARRNPDKLTERQRDYLDRWGYPYVMEEFRFHMTLTCRLSTERRTPLVANLQNRFAATGLATLPIDVIALCRQDDAASRFRIIGHWPLRAS
jgi:putative phosphonate metabolism protein